MARRSTTPPRHLARACLRSRRTPKPRPGAASPRRWPPPPG
uniref:Uncharacterized protein n=1 Tax=Arundo donax TaxID=35708 RepID=A0A0A9A7T3_ARUDO